MHRAMRRDPCCRLRHLLYNHVFKNFFFTSGCHYWEVLIVRTSRSSRIVVGVVPNEDFDGETLHGPAVSWVNGAFWYCANGTVMKNGVEVAQVSPFGEGDCVGVYVDMNSQQMSFFLNGEEQQPCSADNRCEPAGSEVMVNPAKQVDLKNRSWKSIHNKYALFAAITFSPATDEVDIYSAHAPIGKEDEKLVSTSTCWLFLKFTPLCSTNMKYIHNESRVPLYIFIVSHCRSTMAENAKRAGSTSEVWGYVIVLAAATSFIAAMYTMVGSKVLRYALNDGHAPATQATILSSIETDFYYCYLIPLTIPISILAFYANWVSLKFFRHN
ncbi:TPA: hypothetical protein N0F65_003583 [Lagenidium giganteum]|uniref:B30.2/SPRY domain-containing protein n=1 Tax=Lagenidium giganteum TaxID=4803 RepID=A0AAV2Z3L0_9STRA|nr:TPA: hypothetical protein N0F65_003583 [Lagenidium giganteum]